MYANSNSSRIAADSAVQTVLNEIIRVTGIVPEDKLWLTIAQCKPVISAALQTEHNKRKAS